MSASIPPHRLAAAIGPAALLLLGLALYGPRLDASGLWDPWEPRYTQAAREMSERGEWVVPFYRGDPRLNKPPLTYWLIALGQAAIGVNETAARLPSAVFALLSSMGLLFAFAARGKILEGFLAGAALLTCPQWILTGRFATPDMPLAALLGLALAAALALPAAKGRARQLLAVGVVLCVAAAGLVDWPRGLLLPLWAVLAWGALELGWKGAAMLGVTAASYHAAQLAYSPLLNLLSVALAVIGAAWVLRKGARVRLAPQLAGTALVLLLVSPWFVAASNAEPDEMSIFEYQHTWNLGEAPGEHTGPYGYALIIAAVGAFPWVAAAVAGGATALGRHSAPDARLLLGAWIGALLFFELAEARMGHFYGVMQPALAGLAGLGLAASVRKRSWSGAAALVVLGLCAWLVWNKPSRLFEVATVKLSLYGLVEPSAPALAAAALWLLVVLAAYLSRRPSWLVASVLPPALFCAWLGIGGVPALEAKKSLRPVWSAYLRERRGDEPIGLHGAIKDSAIYYGHGTLLRVKKNEDLERFLSGAGDKYLILPRSTFRDLDRAALPGEWQVLEATHPSHILVRYKAGAAPGEP